ncbi:MAG: helix-turn-helix domain-containing protein [Ginsengibacter sp.]
MDLQNKKILSIDEACQFLGYKKSYLYKLTSSGLLPFSKPNGKKIFFEREKLENFMLRNSSDGIVEREIKAATYETTKGGSRL